MAPTKSRRARVRRARPSPARRVPDIMTVGRSLLRPQLVGTLLIVLAAASLPLLLPLASVVEEARNGLVRALGLHAITLVVLVAAAGAVLALRRSGWLRRHRRHVAGIMLLLLFSAGVLGRWYPTTSVGAVDLASRSAGGELGRWMAAEAWTVALWALTLLLGFGLLWPRTARSLARAVPPAILAGAVAVWRLGLHRHAGRALRAASRAISFRRAAARRTSDLAGATAEALPPPFTEELAGPASPALPAGATAAASSTPARPATQIPMDMETPAREWRHSADGWQLPPITLLDVGKPPEDEGLDNQRRARLIEQTLASFGVDAKVTQINEGPAVTQFGVEPGWDVRTRSVVERDAAGNVLLDQQGQPRTKDIEVSRTRVRVNRITALQNDLALGLAAPAVRIEAPVPGKQMVGIEVPNLTATTVTLRSVLESPAFAKAAKRAPLPIALGMDVSGDSVVADLGAMPHLLIAGATGSGKSVCLNTIIISLLMEHSPEQLRLVLIDPKRVELTPFSDIPHLAFSEIVVDMDRVVGTLQAVINEMESRYRRFAQAGVRDIKRYNEREDVRPLAYWVVVIDELADLMIAAPYQVETQIVRLAQLARATGIHLVIATQRPSVDVVTGLIKANFPTRIAFAMASQVDSRTVLDQAGAEKLLGRGDMLYQPTDAQRPRRLQGVYVSDQETERVVAFWTQDRFGELAPEKHDDLLREATAQVEQLEVGATDPNDPMLKKALDLARESRTLSTSMLQRRLRIGYPRAARLMDDLEERGVVGPAEHGGSSRPVLLEVEPASIGAGADSASETPPAGDD